MSAKTKKAAPPKKAAKKTGSKKGGVEPQDELKQILDKPKNEAPPAASEQPQAPKESGDAEVTFENIPLKDIKLSPTNPRTSYDEKATNELADSVRMHGVLQPVLVRPFGKPGKYQLIAGSRRYKASEIAGRTTIPATIRELTDDQALEIQIIENLQREGVSPIEEAVAYENLMKLKGFDINEVAHRVGKAPSFIAQRLKLNELSDDFKKLLFEERITITDALKVCKLKPEDQKDLFENECDCFGEDDRIIIDNGMLRQYMYDLTDAPFDITDSGLSDEFGACTGCQFNTASNALLFPEQTHEARCTNRDCFKLKCELSFSLQLRKALDDSSTVLINVSYGDADVIKHYAARGLKVYTRYEYEFSEEKARGAKKAFVVNGQTKGTFRYIKLNVVKNNEVAATAEGSAISSRRAALEEQIRVLEQREERKEELDFVHAMPVFYKALENRGIHVMSTEPMSIIEKAAAIWALEEKSGWYLNNDNSFWECIKAPDDIEGDSVREYEWLKEQPESTLDGYITMLVKNIMLNMLHPFNDACPQKHGQMLALLDQSRVYAHDLHEKVIADIEVDRKKRRAKLAPRIEAIRKEIAELPADAPKPAKKK